MRRGMRIGIATIALIVTTIAGIVGYNVSVPPEERLVDYAFTPSSETGNGIVFAGWQKPIPIHFVTDADTVNARVMQEVERVFGAIDGSVRSNLKIYSSVLTEQSVGEEQGTVVVCICREIFSVARKQLALKLEFEVPNEKERRAFIDAYERRAVTSFVSTRVSASTREIESATVLISASTPADRLTGSTMEAILAALSPQLGQKGRMKELIVGAGEDMRLNEIGLKYLTLILDEGVTPGMSRADFQVAARALENRLMRD